MLKKQMPRTILAESTSCYSGTKTHWNVPCHAICRMLIQFHGDNPTHIITRMITHREDVTAVLILYVLQRAQHLTAHYLFSETAMHIIIL